MEKEKQILELVKKYNPDGYDHLVKGDKVVVEEHLSWLCEKYTLEQIEEDLKAGKDSYITLDVQREMKKAVYEDLKEKVERLEELVKNGGPGSGNFGHAGRPGVVGGSSSASAPVRALGKGIADRTRETGGLQ